MSDQRGSMAAPNIAWQAAYNGAEVRFAPKAAVDSMAKMDAQTNTGSQERRKCGQRADAGR